MDLRRHEALVGVRGRHADVDDGDVGLVHAHLAHELVGRARLGHDLEAAVREQPRDALAEEHRVISEHDAHVAILRYGVPGVRVPRRRGGQDSGRRATSAAPESSALGTKPRAPERPMRAP